MDPPRFDHVEWIADHEDDDVAHLDWSAVLPADPGDLAVEPPTTPPDDAGGLRDDPGLVELIASSHDVDPEQVLLTLGATEALLLSVWAAVGDGDRAAVESPTYQPLVDHARLAGADVARFRRRRDDGFRVPQNEVADLLDDGVSLVLLSNLHNPTGVGVADDLLDGICRRARQAGSVVVVDEVYRRSALGRTARPACRHPAGVSVDSLTKFFGYGNVRLGWLVGPAELVDRARRLKRIVNPTVTPQGVAVATWCLRNEAELTRHAKARLDANRKLVETWVDQHGLEWVPPTGGSLCTVPVPEGWDDDVAFARRALKEGVCIVPGSFFGLPGHVRIGFGMATDMLEVGLQRLSGLY